MTIRHMRIFQEVCRCGCNTTRAAEALHITQPAVSLAIRELESYYGVVLFDRIGRRLVLTETGRRFQQYGLRIVDLFDTMERELRNGDRFGLLRVGASITIGSQFLPHYVRTFRYLYPGVQVRAEVEDSRTLEERLLTSSLDLALMEGRPQNPAILWEDYMQDRLVVVCPNNGTFRQNQVLTPEEFQKQDFLLRERGSGTREEFERIAAGAGLSVTPVWEATSTTALVNAVICGLGISVLPYRMVCGPLRRGRIVTVQVQGLDLRRCFCIARHKDKYLTPLCANFIQLCRDYEMDYPLPAYNLSLIHI